MKQKKLRDRVIETLFPRSCAERFEFRVAMAKNRRESRRLERAAQEIGRRYAGSKS